MNSKLINQTDAMGSGDIVPETPSIFSDQVMVANWFSPGGDIKDISAATHIAMSILHETDYQAEMVARFALRIAKNATKIVAAVGEGHRPSFTLVYDSAELQEAVAKWETNSTNLRGAIWGLTNGDADVTNQIVAKLMSNIAARVKANLS